MKRLALVVAVLSIAACKPADNTTTDTAAMPAIAPATDTGMKGMTGGMKADTGMKGGMTKTGPAMKGMSKTDTGMKMPPSKRP